MAATHQFQQLLLNTTSRVRAGTFFRVLKFMGMRLLTLLITVVISIFFTVMIASMGGHVDKIRLGEIRETVTTNINRNAAYRNLPTEERNRMIDENIRIQAEAMGLNKPFMVRAVTFMKDALTLNLGRALKMTSDSGSSQVRWIILERLPPTLALFGTSSLLYFFVELVMALFLSRRYGSFLDKLIIGLAPTSTAPAWFYGYFLIIIFAAILKVLPFGGMIDAPIPEDTLGYLLNMLKHMILPLLAIALNQVFLNAYAWRTFFLIYANEDYVEMAKAKGVKEREVQRHYILRPALPTIITTFALTIIAAWGGYPIMETVFSWPGLGRSYYQAVQFYDTPVILGNAVIFAYLLAITVFLLDFIYALVDPRVKIGQSGSQA